MYLVEVDEVDGDNNTLLEAEAWRLEARDERDVVLVKHRGWQT